MKGVAGVIFGLLAIVFFLAAPATAQELVVQQNEAPLLSECVEGSAEVARLPKGHGVRLRFAIAGSSSRCYSVSAEVDGKKVSGYMPKEALEGLEEFEQSRREASSARLVESAIQMIGLPESENTGPSAPAPQVTPSQQAILLRAAAELNDANPAKAEEILAQGALPEDHPTAALLRAKALMQLSRPSKARSVLDGALRNHPNEPQLLAMAGMVAFQLDDVRAAEAYLKRSLKIQPNPSVNRVYERVQREAAGDKSDEKTYGSRFVLRYEGETFGPEVARNLTGAFEKEMNRISFELGCQYTDRLVVIIQSRENYKNTTGAADWSGGRYDGRIRIALPPSGEVDAYVRKTFSHEFVHACLAKMGPWPSWLHEGLAQKFSGDQLDPQSREMLRMIAREDKLPTLAGLAGSWARLNSVQARVAYALALAAVDLFFEVHRAYGVRNLMYNPSQLPQITADLDRRLPGRLQ